ncbi:MAG TPA: molybdenum cofactor guanylyltransferase [Candidatus Anoxymicrobiaceae bacterium]
MATGIILAGGASTRMPGDKAFMEVGGRRVIDIQLEVLEGLFDEILIVTNAARFSSLTGFHGEAARIVEEPVKGKGPLGGILSGLMLSSSRENFVVACDMPFIKRDAVRYILGNLEGYQVAVPKTEKGLEPLHAAYDRGCVEMIRGQLDEGNLKVTGFFDKVPVREIPWEELKRFDPTGKFLLNINSPTDMEVAAGTTPPASRSFLEQDARPESVGALRKDQRRIGTGEPVVMDARTIVVTGFGARATLAAELGKRLEGAASILEVNAEEWPETLKPAMSVLTMKAPVELAQEDLSWLRGRVDLVLVDVGFPSVGTSELGLEAKMKEATGASKVLMYHGYEGRRRVFRKAADMALSRIGGCIMPEEIPQVVIDAVKREAVDNKIPCQRAQELAGELGVPIALVGRALDLLKIKIMSCQLGCF